VKNIFQDFFVSFINKTFVMLGRDEIEQRKIFSVRVIDIFHIRNILIPSLI
jgi:hypothetical protein